MTDDERVPYAPLNRLLRKADAAEALAISVRTLDVLIAKGDLKPTRIGGSVRLSTVEINAYIDRLTNPPAPDTYPWPSPVRKRRVGSRW